MYICDNISNKKIDRAYLENVRSFIERMRSVIPSENLKNMYANIESVSIKHTNRFEYNVGSYYDCIGNNIRVIDNHNTLWHELLHLSSGVYDKKTDTEYNGFRVTKYKNFHFDLDFDIGRGFNEGYTQLLTERYFCDRKHHLCYATEKYIVEAIERIIGRATMEKFYFNADLLGLIRELKKYTSEKEIFDFLNTLDYINEIPECIEQCKKKDKESLRKTIIEKFKSVNHFIIKTTREKDRKIELSVIKKVNICGEVYDIEPEKEIEQYYKKVPTKSA